MAKKWYGKEDKYWRRWSNKIWRRQGKQLREDAPPQRSSQGWKTW